MEQEVTERKSRVDFTKQDFGRMVIADLSNSKAGRNFLKKYSQSEVREIIEHYRLERNQERLREISQLIYAKSPQYQRLIKYFAGMATFAHVITPIKDIRNGANKKKVLKQYADIGELLKLMSLRHEMTKVLNVVFREDVFYGYIHRDKRSFYIQQMPSEICKITSVEDGVYNYSVDMTFFEKESNRGYLNRWAKEIQVKYREWRANKEIFPKATQWVELDAETTICIKMNEDMLEIFPPFAGTFDAIFDIEAFKELRKDREQLGNYMMLAQKLPIRENSEDNNDFLIDKDFMMFFHNQIADIVPENVGVITTPMSVEPVNFEHDKVDRDGVGKATRDFWEATGASQLLFSSQNNTSAGLAMSIQSDEEIVFNLLTQIERWINRYLKNEYSDLMFNVNILPITRYNQDTKYKMYLETATYGVPVKSHLSATVGLDPIEVMNMAFLENDLLEMHMEWIPLMSAHTMSADGTTGGTTTSSTGSSNSSGGAPKKAPSKVSDETSRKQ